MREMLPGALLHDFSNLRRRSGGWQLIIPRRGTLSSDSDGDGGDGEGCHAAYGWLEVSTSGRLGSEDVPEDGGDSSSNPSVLWMGDGRCRCIDGKKVDSGLRREGYSTYEEIMQFDFGPISRTLGDMGDYLGYASLPVHEVVTALLASRNHEEFIAWLWHDTFKALFFLKLKSRDKLIWDHLQLPKSEIERLANSLDWDSQFILRHHFRLKDRIPNDLLSESIIMSNEFTAVYLGSQARFVQLSFACKPAAHTMLLRYCVIEAFLQAASRVVADGISSFNLPFNQVTYSFQQHSEMLMAEQVAAKYQLEIKNGSLYVTHWVPSKKFKTIQLSFGLSNSPPVRESPDSLALIEMLTVYRDELTTVTAVPLFLGDLETVVNEIRTVMGSLLPDILEKVGIILTHKYAATTALSDLVLEQMVEVRPIGDTFNEGTKGKPIHKLIQRPYQLMAEAIRSHTCIVCGSTITEKATESLMVTQSYRIYFLLTSPTLTTWALRA